MTRRRSTRRHGDQGDAERLGGAWRARARHAHLPACSGKGKQLAGTGQHSAGPASGLPGKWPGKTLSLSLSVLILFSILQVCFEFGFETNSIYFASDNIFRS